MVDAGREISNPIGCAFAVFALGLADCKFVRAENMFRTKVTRADAVGTAKNSWRLILAQRRQIATVLQRFVRLAESDADIASQRVIASHAFIRSFEHDDILLSAQSIDD